MNENMGLIVTYEAKTADSQTLTTNFEEIKAEAQRQVEKYSINVTEENIPEAKKMMANFNKVKAEIGERYKFFIDKISAPVNQLKAEKKEIEAIITDGRQKIADGVANFENAKLEAIAARIAEYTKSLCDEKELNFERINTADLIKLSAVTPAGTLAKATKEAIEAKIQALENEILQAKIAEQEKAARREVEEKATKEKAEILARAEREKQEAVERTRAEVRQENSTFYEAQREVLQKPREAENGKAIYTIRAEFEVKAPINAPHDKLTVKIKEMLAAAGITNLSKIEVLNA